MSLRVDVEGRHVTIRGPDANAALVGLPEASWNAGVGAYVVPASAAAAANLRRVLADDVGWSPPALDLLDRAHKAVDARRWRTATDDLPDLYTPPGAPPPWTHQRQAFAFTRDQDAFALWVAMGGGKTRIAAAVADYLDAGTMVVDCPRSVLDEDDVWAKQLARWSPREWLVGGLVTPKRGPRRHPDGRRISKSRPSVADRLDQLQRDLDQARAERRPFCAVVPWDSYWRSELGRWLLSLEIDLWLGDESHRIKAPNGKASKFAAQLRPRADRRGLLSGTPLPHSRLDAYAQYRAADPGIFGTNFVRFKRRYAVEVPVGTGRATKVVGWRNEAEFDRKFHSIAYTWEQDREALGLMEPLWIERTTRLEGEARRIYGDMRRDLIAEFKAGTLVAGNALVKLLRLLQIASGVATADDGSKVQVGTELRDLLADVLDDLPQREPVVVFGQFHSDLDAVHHVCREQGRRSAELSGRVHGGLNVWNAGAADVLAVQNQAGGAGIDLTRASYGVWMNPGLSLGDHLQTIARLDRPGQPFRCTFVRLIVDGTESVRVWDGLDNRREGVDAILAAWRSL